MGAEGRRRLLFVLEYFHPHVGGVETLFAELTTGLARRGHDVTVVTCSLRGAAPEEEWRGVRILRVGVPTLGGRYVFTMKAIPRVTRLARRADLVHTTTYNAAIPAWIAGRLARKPVVITVHEVYAEQWNQLLGLNKYAGYGYRLFEWLVLHLPFAAYHCDSAFTERRLRSRMGVPHDRTDVVYPAVDYAFWEREHQPADLASLADFGADAFVFCSFGRPGVAKGLEYLIEAMAIVRDRSVRARLLMVLSQDPPAQYRRLRARIADLGLDEIVHVIDPVARDVLPGVLAGVDAVVVPSVSEGFGYAAIEAALVGRPVIATTGHSVSEVLPDAVFVPPKDPDALADAMVAMATAPSSLFAPAPAARYEVEHQVDATTLAYERLVRPGPN
jgi:glycosyltransferase involved in cell wall biosynthesis